MMLLTITYKIKTKSKITLIEKIYKDNSTEYYEEIISDDKEVAEVLNKFLVNIVPDLKIPASYNWSKDFQKMNHLVSNAIRKYKYHPSKAMIKSKIDPQRKLSFFSVQNEDVHKNIKFKFFEGITIKTIIIIVMNNI